MPPSRSCDSGDENSGDRSSGKYFDMDIYSDTVYPSQAGESKRSHPRADGQAPERSGTAEVHIHDLQIEVGDRRFYLHKFPLLSKSGRLHDLVFESRRTETDHIVLSDIPGGAPAFEFVARKFYGGKGTLSPHNVAAIRCAAEYLEITRDGRSSLVSMTEDYLNHKVTQSWRDSITVLKSCAELQPWAEELEIVRRCSEAIAWKCSETRKGRDGDWWYHDVGALNIHAFSRVIHALTAQGYSSLVSSAVCYYAERWLHLTKGSDMSTTLKLSSPAPAPLHPSSADSTPAASFTGFRPDIVAKDSRQAQHKNRAILQGIVNLLPPDTGAAATSLSVKFLLKLLRVGCFVNAGSFCKTDLAKRIASQLEKVALDDLLIPAAAGEATYEVDVVLQIFVWYVQEQSWGDSPPQSPRGRVSAGGSDTSRRSSTSSLNSSVTSSLNSSVTSSASSSDLSDSGGSAGSSGSSGSSIRTVSSRGRSVSSDSGSDTESDSSISSGGSFRSSSDTSSSISVSSSNLSSSFRSTTSESSATSIGAFSESSSSSSGSASDDDSSDESSVKLEKKKKPFHVTESRSPSRKTLLPPTTANFKVAQLLESYLEEVAKDSNLGLALFMKLAELFTEFPRDSDDSIYRALDGFLRAHPSLTDTERKSLCRLMDPGALSLAACVHAASNERLPLRVIVQLLFSEQIKLRNEMTSNDVINEKDLGSALPSFSTSTSSSSNTADSSSEATSTTLSSGSSGSSSTSASSSSRTRKSSRRSSRSISSTSALESELAIDMGRSPSATSSPLLGGLSVKNTMRFVLAEIESLRRSAQEMESVKRRLSVMETLQTEMEHLASKFQELAQDYVGMTQQVEELTKASKHAKSGWSSGWKKVTKSFQSKDSSSDPKLDTPPLPPVKLLPTDFPNLPILRTKSETLHPKTSRADSSSSAHIKIPARADSLPVTKPKTDSATLRPKTPRADSLPQLPKGAPSPELTKRGEAMKPGTPVHTPREFFKTPSVQGVVVKSEASTPSTSKRGEGAKPGTPLQTPLDSFQMTGQESAAKSEASTPPKSGPFKTRDGYVITAHRSHHVEDVLRRSVRSRSTSPDYVRSRLHYKDSDSVTSTSSYSKTSSGRGSHQHQRSGRNGGSREKHRSHQAEHGASHRKHRQKEGAHNGQSQLSGDAPPARHSSATHRSHHSGRHRYSREGSAASHHTGSEQHSGSLQSEQQRRKDRHKEHHGHRQHSFSDDSTASSGFETHRRRQHRT